MPELPGRVASPGRTVTTPGTAPDVQPGRRMHPGEICPTQRAAVPGKIRTVFD